jgi:hypothetical protein
MANWSRNTISLVGAGAPEFVVYINSHLEPMAHPTTNEPWMVYVDIAPLLTGPPDGLWGGLNLYHEHVPLTLNEKGVTEFWCETKWQPPLGAFVR